MARNAGVGRGLHGSEGTLKYTLSVGEYTSLSQSVETYRWELATFRPVPMYVVS